jgi:hypothetical protein
MKTRLIASIATLALLSAFVPLVASADSPHFVGTPSCTKSGTTITCSGKAAGLAGTVTEAFLTASSVSVTFQCQNKGQNFAPGHPAVTNSVTGSTQTITPRNGQITFSPSLTAPAVNPSGNCPNSNWTVVITSVTFTDVVLHIQQNGVDILTDDFGTIDP